MAELPAFGDLSVAELEGLLVAAQDEGNDITEALSHPDTADGADLDRLAELADYADGIRAELAARAAAQLARAEQVAQLSARLNPAAAPEVVVEEATLASTDPEVEVEVEAPEASVDEAVVAAVDVPLTGTVVRHPAPRTIIEKAPKVTLPTQVTREVAIVASAGVPGMQGGQSAELASFVAPAMKRWGSYPAVVPNGTRIQDELFQVVAPARDPRLVANGHNDQDVMQYAADAARLVGANGAAGIVAAGGWCAPAEQRFDICTLAELDGVLDVPTIGMPRGSISYFRNLDYRTVATAIAAGEFTFTDAQLQANPPVVKPCFEIPCATPVHATLDVVGICLRDGLLQHKAFPELIEAWMKLALIAFAHYRNARNIAQMVAGSQAVAIPATFGAISAVVDAILLEATAYRIQNGMSKGAELEVVLPYWWPALAEADEERRQFNSQEDDWEQDFAEAGVRVQYIKDFQDASFLTFPVTTWPTTVQFLLYAPGAWVRGSEDIITVSTLVDSTLLQTNREQLLFLEAADVMLPWCGPSWIVTVPVCPSGATAGPIASTPGTYVCND